MNDMSSTILSTLSAQVHSTEALLTKRLDPGLQTDRDIIGDVDNDVKHQPQVDHARLLMVLQPLPHGIYVDIKADGTGVAGKGINSILVLTFVHYPIDWRTIGAPQHALRTPQ